MPNPDGTNQFGGFHQQPGYGDIKRLAGLKKAAPMTGVPVAANAPQQAQQAVGGATAPLLQPAPGTVLAEEWAELAMLTGDPLVGEYAARAQA